MLPSSERQMFSRGSPVLHTSGRETVIGLRAGPKNISQTVSTDGGTVRPHSPWPVSRGQHSLDIRSDTIASYKTDWTLALDFSFKFRRSFVCELFPWWSYKLMQWGIRGTNKTVKINGSNMKRQCVY
ncbi:hypothetical protein ElyMa_001923500 [Elysia marginata]|uniref:Uncharacterized protein n=1 Tax=Elysia marginata TaxID=1093978 RepID=A0AAV4EVV6_9GAST|nr:hypothetical protein ElyMa_001923500 [Elysia marginata]